MDFLNGFLDFFTGYNWVVIPAALLAIVIHELSHGFVAYLLGDPTAKNAGRLTLNPISHIDVFGLLAMIFFRFGWAKPVPVNPYYFKNRRSGMALCALAGPLSNVIMAFISTGLLATIMHLNVSVNYFWNLILNFLIIFAMLNIGLAIFNLLPIPPLDGSKVLFSVLPQNAYGFILQYEQFGFIVLIALFYFKPFLDFISQIRGDVIGFIFGIFGISL